MGSVASERVKSAHFHSCRNVPFFTFDVLYRILPVLSADAEKVAELKVFLSLESLMSNENLCL